jgi:hypothetical protein
MNVARRSIKAGGIVPASLSMGGHMATAIIGHTGFVGGNLCQQRDFDFRFNSKNFREMKGAKFDEIVCAGVSAVKWMANREPDEDLRRINELQDVLKTVEVGRFILISTIDVYPVLSGADEDFDCHGVDNHAYGRHRLGFEGFVTSSFDDAFVFRLGALFGQGLKKNIIFDLLNNNCLEMINPKCSFQYGDLRTLWQDVEAAMKHDIRLLNMFNEPIPTRAILERFFPHQIVGSNQGRELHYDLRTKYAPVLGGTGGYLRSATEILDGLACFVSTYSPTPKS